MRRTNFGRHHRKISPHLLLSSLSEAFNEYPAYEYLSTRRVTIVNHRIENFSPVVNQARTPTESISRRLSVCCARITMRGHRPSANAKGRSVILPDLGVFIFKTTSFANALRLLCDVFLDFFCCAPLTLAKGVRIKATHLHASFAFCAAFFGRRKVT